MSLIEPNMSAFQSLSRPKLAADRISLIWPLKFSSDEPATLVLYRRVILDRHTVRLHVHRKLSKYLSSSILVTFRVGTQVLFHLEFRSE